MTNSSDGLNDWFVIWSILPPTVSRRVRLGVGQLSRAYDQTFKFLCLTDACAQCYTTLLPTRTREGLKLQRPRLYFDFHGNLLLKVDCNVALLPCVNEKQRRGINMTAPPPPQT
jgi:hypothetical protein